MNNAKNIIIGFSGGLDSSVLIDLLLKKYPDLKNKIILLHVNHGLSQNALLWEEHCKNQANIWGLKLNIEHINESKPSGESIEAWARRVRYKIFANYIQDKDILLTAHHMNDQAETFLLNCLRGSGVRGMRSMPQIKAFEKGKLIRPLLNFTRADLESWVLSNNLKHIEDDSNLDNKFDRNFLRNEIIPKLQDRWPKAVEQFAKAARFSQDIFSILEEDLNLDKYRDKYRDKNLDNDYLDLSEIYKLSHQKQAFIIRSWLSENNIKMPSEKKLSEFLHQVLKQVTNITDSHPELLLEQDNIINIKKVYLFYYDNKLYLVDDDILQNKNLSRNYEQDIKNKDISAKDISQLPDYAYYINKDFCLTKDYFERFPYAKIRFRRGGEIVKWRGGKHKPLKKVLNEFKVLPWMRDFVPLLVVDGIVVWIIGL